MKLDVSIVMYVQRLLQGNAYQARYKGCLGNSIINFVFSHTSNCIFLQEDPFHLYSSHTSDRLYPPEMIARPLEASPSSLATGKIGPVIKSDP